MKKLLLSVLCCLVALNGWADEQRKITLSNDNTKETINLSYCNIFVTLLNPDSEDTPMVQVEVENLDESKLLALFNKAYTEKQVKKLAADVMEEFGRIDVLVNNAGMVQVGMEEDFSGFLDMTYESWDDAIDRNLNITFNVTKEIMPFMVDAGYGRIVNVSSVTGPVVSNPGEGSYSAAKAGVVGLSRALAACGLVGTVNDNLIVHVACCADPLACVGAFQRHAGPLVIEPLERSLCHALVNVLAHKERVPQVFAIAIQAVGTGSLYRRNVVHLGLFAAIFPLEHVGGCEFQYSLAAQITNLKPVGVVTGNHHLFFGPGSIAQLVHQGAGKSSGRTKGNNYGRQCRRTYIRKNAFAGIHGTNIPLICGFERELRVFSVFSANHRTVFPIQKKNRSFGLRLFVV